MARSSPPTASPFMGPPHLQPLDAKETLFVEEYLKLLHPSRAAHAAGYGNDLRDQAYRWVEAGEGSDPEDRPHIGHAIQMELARRTSRNSLTADRVLQEVARLAFSNIRDLYDENGELIPAHQLPEDVSAALSSMEIEFRGRGEDSYPVKKFRQYDKVAALNLATRILKLVEKGEGDAPAPEPPKMGVTLKPPPGLSVPPVFRGLVGG